MGTISLSSKEKKLIKAKFEITMHLRIVQFDLVVSVKSEMCQTIRSRGHGGNFESQTGSFDYPRTISTKFCLNLMRCRKCVGQSETT
jgi:hypothetical protein